MNALQVRRFELLVLGVGVLVALFILGLGAKGAFRANMAGGHGVEGFLLTSFSFLIMGAIVGSPYAVLAFLGQRITKDGIAGFHQVAGLLISALTTCASIYLYIDAHFVVSHDRSSTAGLVFVAVPIVLVIVGGGLYGVLVFAYSRFRKRQAAEGAL